MWTDFHGAFYLRKLKYAQRERERQTNKELKSSTTAIFQCIFNFNIQNETVNQVLLTFLDIIWLIRGLKKSILNLCVCSAYWFEILGLKDRQRRRKRVHKYWVSECMRVSRKKKCARLCIDLSFVSQKNHDIQKDWYTVIQLKFKCVLQSISIACARFFMNCLFIGSRVFQLFSIFLFLWFLFCNLRLVLQWKSFIFDKFPKKKK